MFSGPSEFESFTADPVDAPDGLTGQFRLPAKFGSMPPRPMEGMDLDFQLTKNSATPHIDYASTP